MQRIRGWIWRLSLVCVALLNAVCLAGIWTLLSLQGVQHAWLGPAVALALVLLLHLQGMSKGWARALVAAVLYALAAVYAVYLEASGRIAAELGLTLLEGLRRIGPEMAWAWYRAHSEWSGHLLLMFGLLLAFALGRWMGASHRPRSR